MYAELADASRSVAPVRRLVPSATNRRRFGSLKVRTRRGHRELRQVGATVATPLGSTVSLSSPAQVSGTAPRGTEVRGTAQLERVLVERLIVERVELERLGVERLGGNGSSWNGSVERVEWNGRLERLERDRLFGNSVMGRLDWNGSAGTALCGTAPRERVSMEWGLSGTAPAGRVGRN